MPSQELLWNCWSYSAKAISKILFFLSCFDRPNLTLLGIVRAFLGRLYLIRLG